MSSENLSTLFRALQDPSLKPIRDRMHNLAIDNKFRYIAKLAEENNNPHDRRMWVPIAEILLTQLRPYRDEMGRYCLTADQWEEARMYVFEIYKKNEAIAKAPGFNIENVPHEFMMLAIGIELMYNELDNIDLDELNRSLTGAILEIDRVTANGTQGSEASEEDSEG